jgi:hypothetical protein
LTTCWYAIAAMGEQLRACKRALIYQGDIAQAGPDQQIPAMPGQVQCRSTPGTQIQSQASAAGLFDHLRPNFIALPAYGWPNRRLHLGGTTPAQLPDDGRQDAAHQATPTNVDASDDAGGGIGQQHHHTVSALDDQSPPGTSGG